MDWKTCAVCDREFERAEERELIVCEHGSMLCPCGVYGYACLRHQREIRESGSKSQLRLSVMAMPGDWELEVVSAGLTVLRAVMRQPQPAGLMDGDEERGL